MEMIKEPAIRILRGPYLSTRFPIRGPEQPTIIVPSENAPAVRALLHPNSCRKATKNMEKENLTPNEVAKVIKAMLSMMNA